MGQHVESRRLVSTLSTLVNFTFPPLPAHTMPKVSRRRQGDSDSEYKPAVKVLAQQLPRRKNNLGRKAAKTLEKE